MCNWSTQPFGLTLVQLAGWETHQRETIIPAQWKGKRCVAAQVPWPSITGRDSFWVKSILTMYRWHRAVLHPNGIARDRPESTRINQLCVCMSAGFQRCCPSPTYAQLFQMGCCGWMLETGQLEEWGKLECWLVLAGEKGI